ncbi:cache domain-containing sensor histidine kinase [Paenibacillus sp. 481]|uniref:cache domain-containing sensor histidine kinase n=1 Tax=Paenibacillus sp. 481 TaxID=2835869 RepID=UPI001E5AC3D7|nr:sensor histidine kinase [Paenibacillus sp. 481]UHA75029.1 histidine kinase [Paenibacillus sp. 481]
MRWNSIRTKLILFMLIATIVPTFATMAISYNYTTETLKKRAIQENKQLIFQGRHNLMNFLENINRASLTVYTDFEFMRLLERGYDDPNVEAHVYTTLQNISSSMRDIWQVYLYRNEHQRATLVTQNVPRRSYGVDPYGGTVTHTEYGVRMQPTHQSHSYGFGDTTYYFPSEQVFTLHRPIYRIPSTEQLGLLSIDVKLEALAAITEQLFAQGEEDLYVVDDDGYVFYSSDQAVQGKRLHEEWYVNGFANRGNSGHFEQDNALFIHERIEAPLATWTLVKKIPKPYLLRDANRAAVFNIVLLGVSLLVIIAATVIVSLRITKPIAQLVHYMNQVQSGKLDVDIRPVSNDEIGVVSKRFRSMMDTINNLILREYKLELANKTNQLKALQAQINPHFMNNALQSIGTLALQHNAPRIYGLISALARMMRYSMYNEESTATLREELDHVKAYLQLQGQRFEDTFTVHYDTEQTTMHVRLPKMTLQPLVENYFKHGLNRSGSFGELSITSRWVSAGSSVEQEADPEVDLEMDLETDRPLLLELVVEDNGTGMEAARLTALNERLGSLEPFHTNTAAHGAANSRLSVLQQAVTPYEVVHYSDGSGHAVQQINNGMSADKYDTESLSRIGLVNVLTRLMLFNQGEAHMRVEAVQPHGTRVVIHLQVERDGE